MTKQKKIDPSKWAQMSPAQKVANLPADKREEFLKDIDLAELEHVWEGWWARPNQIIPREDDEYYPLHLLLTGRGWGKALSIDTPIPTPNGWTRMGDLQVGDTVYDEKGNHCTVTQTHPIHTPKEMYRIRFSDRSTIDACGDHLWTVVPWHMKHSINTATYRSELKYEDIEWNNFTTPGGLTNRVVDTNEIYNDFQAEIQGPNGRISSNYAVGYNGALKGSYVPPPTDNKYTTSEYLTGFNLKHLKPHELPVDLLRGTRQQRWNIIQGICDAEGFVHGHTRRYIRMTFNGYYGYRREHFYFITELIRSMGYKVIEGDIESHGSFGEFPRMLTWLPHTHMPFRHPEKAYQLNLPKGKNSETFFKFMRYIEKINPTPARCITVDSESSLFLAGPGMTPTHNTRTMSEWIRRQAMEHPGCRIGILGRTASDVRDIMINGEALALDTEVPTPTGWTTMGDLKVGDVIYGGDGKPCTVTKAYQVLDNRPCYELDISGQKVIADANHKWITHTRGQRRTAFAGGQPLPIIRTTEEIANTLIRAGQTNHSIVSTVVVGKSTDLPVDPYLLGYWLGDGDSDESRLTVGVEDQENIIREITRAGFGYTINKDIIRINITGGFRKQLGDAGLLRNKHVPTEYFRASLEDRLELIRGLMDSDGTALPDGKQEFSNNREVLIDAMYELLSSVGVRVRKQRADKNGTVKLIFCSGQKIFKLKRKADRVPPLTVRHMYRYIRKADLIESVPVRCIEVDSEDHTFLITRSFIRTHNSGVLNVGPEDERPELKPSQRLLIWPNGSKATYFSAEVPDQLRGQQFHYFACDELAAYTNFLGVDGISAFDNMRIATRLGAKPHGVVATTPKKVPVLRQLIEESKEEGKVRIVRGSTMENTNLSEAYRQVMLNQFGGTAAARQELEGEMLDENPEGALWTPDMIDPYRVLTQAPPRCDGGIIIAVDPSVSDTPKDEAGIVVIGFSNNAVPTKRHAFVLEDASMLGAPNVWGQRVVQMYKKWHASAIIVETNQGRGLLNSMLHSIDPTLRIIGVNASQGKKLRAEPVTLPYQQGRVHHWGVLAELETQLTSWEPEFSKKSPDRLDALVHGITATLINPPPGLPMRRQKITSGSGRQIQKKMGTGIGRSSPRQMKINRSR